MKTPEPCVLVLVKSGHHTNTNIFAFALLLLRPPHLRPHIKTIDNSLWSLPRAPRSLDPKESLAAKVTNRVHLGSKCGHGICC